MNIRHCFLFAVCTFFISTFSHADQASRDALLAPANQFLAVTESFQRQSDTKEQQLTYFLVDKGSKYNGDTLKFGWRQYQLSRESAESTGRYFFFSDLLLLWDWRTKSHFFINVESVSSGVWTSCWGQETESVRSCDETTAKIYIFQSEDIAVEFSNAGIPPDDLAMGPEPEPVEPEPAPEPVESEPAPEPVDPPPAPDPVQPDPVPEQDISQVTCAAPSAELKSALLRATNESRAQARQCGNQSYSAASELLWNDSLAAAALKHSNDMASNNFFDHTGSDGLQVWDRANAEGYQYRYIGENIAAGQANVGAVQNGWINSPGHCGNIMSPEIIEMGAACVTNAGSDYQHYWTVVVGSPR